MVLLFLLFTQWPYSKHFWHRVCGVALFTEDALQEKKTKMSIAVRHI